MVDFYVNLVSCDLVKLDYLTSLFVDSLGFSTETIMCISRECYFHLSSLLFAFCMPSVSFSCFIALARTSSMVLDINGQSGHPYLVTDLREKAFNLLSLDMIFMFWRDALFWGYFLLFVVCWVFVINYCWILSCFFCIRWYDRVVFFLLYTVNMLDYTNWFFNIDPALYSQDNAHLVMVCYSVLIY